MNRLPVEGVARRQWHRGQPQPGAAVARDSWPPAVPHCSSTCRPFSRTQAALDMVRQMKHCKLSFVSKNDAFG